MKKKIAILSIFMIAMLLLTCNVFATETFDYEGTTYVIDEVKLKISSLGDEIDFLGKDENNNYIFHDYMNEIMYKVNEKECTAMSSQEILDFMNNKYDTYYFAQDDLNIYQEKFKALGLSDQGKFITEDKTVDSNKIYFNYRE